MQMSPVARMLDSFLCKCYTQIHEDTGLNLYRDPYSELMNELYNPITVLDPSIEYVLMKRFMLVDLKIDNGPYNKIITESIEDGYVINGYVILIVLEYDTAKYIKIDSNIMQLLCYFADNYEIDCGENGNRLVKFDYLDTFGVTEGYAIDTDIYRILNDIKKIMQILINS